MKRTQKRVLLVVSGGVESATIMAMARHKGPSWLLHAVFFDYGQKPMMREDRAVEKFAREYGIHWERAQVSLPWMAESALVDPEVFLTLGDKKEQVSKAHIVPYRNLAFLGMAANYAAILRADEIHVGFDYVASKKGAARDKSPAFVRAFQGALREAADAGYKGPTLIAPLQGNAKSTTVRLATRLGVSLGDTWSCYNNEPLHCGECGSCRERMAAFTAAKINDPTKYVIEQMEE